ncbi:hypothetical protein P873_11950 [Arenimonas composti TR7-09 = DSM 18010]|uniref:Uncharacterized protein n=1 Tax=Arenimonas composti TR7-09 = DSM 18010 TaxID=1121013 RepID=A0A091BBN4_9GAMM|nr:hypothetical protein P873_11950 [Arenimonas composti TR7-09 = DSM 18010]
MLEVERVDGAVRTSSLLQLPAPPVDAIRRDGRVLLHLERNGWVDFGDPEAPRWLGCELPAHAGET